MNTEAKRRENTERKAIGVNSMVIEKIILTVVWTNKKDEIKRESV